MAAAPQVRELKNLVTELNKSIDPQNKLIDESITANATAGQAQELGLAAKKDTAFENIVQGSQDKGMMFSGFTPDEQAKYTAGTYLPALAQLQATIAETRSNLLGKKADLSASVYNKAFDTRENDITAKRGWDMQQARNEFEQQQAEKQYQRDLAKLREQQRFEAAEAQKSRSFTAGQNAAGRAAEKGPDVNAITANVGGYLAGKVGSDGKVSPKTFQEGRQKWIAAGGSADSYAQAFYGYVNQSHKQDYF